MQARRSVSLAGRASNALNRLKRSPIAIITGCALVIRLAYAFAFSMQQQLRGDELYYSAQAHMNSKGLWFEQPFASGMPAADHPPLAALLYTPAAALFQDGGFIAAQRITNIVLGVALIPLMAALGTQIANRRVGIIAAVLTAVSLNFVMNDTLVLAETSACVCLAAALLFAHRSLTATTVNAARRSALGIGIALALGALARPEMILLIGLVGAPVTWLAGRRARGRISDALVNWVIVGLCAAAIIGPWVLWNRARFDESVTLSTNDGFTMAGANCLNTYYGPNLGGYSFDCATDVEFPAGSDASVAAKYQRDAAVSYARANRNRLPLVATMRLARVWYLDEVPRVAREGPLEGRTIWGFYVGLVQFWLLAPFAVAGLRSLARGYRWVLLSVPLVVSFSAMVFNAQWRVRVPADVVLILAAAVGMAMFSRRPTQDLPAQE